MSKNSILLAALGGAAAAVLITNYLNTDKGKQMVESASGVLKDLTSKATELAKNNLAGVKNSKAMQTS